MNNSDCFGRPVAILIDDLHWADRSSLELLQHLTRHTRGNRVLIVGSYRDVEVNRSHPLENTLLDLGRERLIVEVEVRRLSQPGTGQLVAAALGGSEISMRLVRLVHRHTEGNPFFVEAVVRTLVDRGDIYRNENRWECRAVEEIEIPKSVRSAIGQRLSRLRPESQAVLQEASVLGARFTFEDLLRMCSRDEGTIESAIEDALAAGLLRETGREAYSFSHSLTQGTLYSELPSRKRRRLHLAAGSALEQLAERAGSHRTGELAWHFLEADEPPRALKYSLEAARADRDVFAYDEAEKHYRIGLELSRELGDSDAEVRALEGLGTVLRLVARYDEALDTLDAAFDIHHARRNSSGERWTTAHIGRVHALRGSAEEGISRVKALLAEIEADESSGESSAGETSSRAALYTALANLYQALDQSSAQLEAAEKALEIARAAGDSQVGARLLAEGQMWRASALAELGDLDDARRMLEDVIPLAEAAGDLLILSRSLNVLAGVYSEAGQYEKERAYIEQALQAAKRLGDPTREWYMNYRLGWHLLVRGQWPEARRYLMQAHSSWMALGNVPVSAWTLVSLAYIDLATGNVEEGERRLSQGEEVAKSLPQESHPLALAQWLNLDWRLRRGDWAGAAAYLDAKQPLSNPSWLSRALLLPVTAWTELERGNVTLACDLANEATEIATAEQNRTILVEALRVQATALAREGAYDEAHQAIEEAIRTARAIDQPYAEGRCLEAFGRIELDRGEPASAHPLFQQAVDAYKNLGAVDAERVLELMEAEMQAALATPHA